MVVDSESVELRVPDLSEVPLRWLLTVVLDGGREPVVLVSAFSSGVPSGPRVVDVGVSAFSAHA